METSSKKPKQENKKRQKKNFAIKAYNKTKSKIIKKSSKKLNLDKIVTNSKYSEYENLLNQADNLTDSIKRLEKERQLRKLEQIERTAQNIKILKYENKKNNDTSSKIIALLVFILLFAGAVFLTTKNFDNIYQSLFSAKVYTSSTLQGDTKIHFIDVGQGDCV